MSGITDNNSYFDNYFYIVYGSVVWVDRGKRDNLIKNTNKLIRWWNIQITLSWNKV